MNKYIAQHPKRKMIEVMAHDSYSAAKVAASHWGMKNTAGVSVILIAAGGVEKPIDTASL